MFSSKPTKKSRSRFRIKFLEDTWIGSFYIASLLEYMETQLLKIKQ